MTRFLHYTLRLRAAMLVSSQAGDPNSVRASAAVPGSTIRGALAAALVRSGDERRLSDLILSGHVRYLPAWPTRADDPRRTIPIPLSWRAEKLAPERVHDLAAAWPEGPQLVAPSFDIIVPGARLFGIRVPVRSRFHHQRDRRKGRPTAERGAIFTYESLPEGTVLAGAIAIQDAEESAIRDRADVLRDLLSSQLRLGRSRRTQYGGDPVVAVDESLVDREVRSWTDLVSADVAAGDEVRVLLTSDAVVRNPVTGQVDPTAVEEAVVAALGGRVEVRRRFVATRVVGGFNVKWRAALPQSLAVAAGSVLVVRARERISLSDVLRFESSGVGERRIDGFGACLVLTAPSATVPLSTAPEIAAAVESPAPRWREDRGLTEEERSVLVILEERLREQVMADAVSVAAARLVQSAGDSVGGITRSLLARLRAPLRAGDVGLVRLRSWLRLEPRQGGLRSRARGKLESPVKLGRHRTLGEWLLGAIGTAGTEQAPELTDEERDDLVSLLFEGAPLERASIDGTVAREDKERIAAASRRALIDAVLAGLARRAAAGEGRNGAG